MADFPAARRRGGDGIEAAVGCVVLVVIVAFVVGLIMVVVGLVHHEPWTIAWGVALMLLGPLLRLIASFLP